MTPLTVMLFDRVVGEVSHDSRGRVCLDYEDAWRNTPTAVPLSLSLPLHHRHHDSPAVAAYLWGLLPDNEQVLQSWARRFHTSAGSVLGLLSHVGEDCAGAVRLVRPERVERVLGEGQGDIEWLDRAHIAERLRLLREDPSLWRRGDDAGQFSLAGAQGKTALLLEGTRWGLPSGRVPTTHVLKPPLPGMQGHVENEHFCLELARALGLPTASSRVERFEDEVAIVVQRYDRVHANAGLVRAHQEDTCQALGIHPTRKYQNEGGPGPADIVALLRAHSSRPDDDVATFVDALAFNWLIAGTDAHAKNYSLLLTAGGRIRLAPLYDLASALPYEHIDRRRMKLAMKIGGKYRIAEIGRRQWDKLATELQLDAPSVRERVLRLANDLPELAPTLLGKLTDAGLSHSILPQLAERISQRARACSELLA